MRVKLGKRETLQLLPFTGGVYCGCRYLNGLRMVVCNEHNIGRHRAPREEPELVSTDQILGLNPSMENGKSGRYQ